MYQRIDRDTGADRIVNQLAYRYDGLFDRERIDTLFHDSYDRLAETARVTVFLPTLAEKLTVQRLDALAQAEGKIAKRVPEILFVCVGNASRSQMAAALARHHAGTRVHIRTGGSNPHEAIYPEVEQVMAETGLSLAEEFPKPPSPTKSSPPRTSSSPWAAANTAPSCRAADTRTGPSTTPPTSNWTASGPSATTSTTMCKHS